MFFSFECSEDCLTTDAEPSLSYSFLRHLCLAACEKHIKWQVMVERFPQIMPDNSIKENQEEPFVERGNIEERWSSCGQSQNKEWSFALLFHTSEIKLHLPFLQN